MVTDFRRFECTLTPEDNDDIDLSGTSKAEICMKALSAIDESESEFFNIRLSGFDKDGNETAFMSLGEGVRPLHRTNLVRMIESFGLLFEVQNSTLFDATVTKCGNSLVLKITEQCRTMGLDPGDHVRVRMDRIMTYEGKDNIGKLFDRKRTHKISDSESYLYDEANKPFFDRFIEDYGIIGQISLRGIYFEITDEIMDHYSAFRTRDGNVILASMPYDKEGAEENAVAFADAHGLEYDYITDYSWYHRGETQLVIFWKKGVDLSVSRS
ncbi:MAG: hypothetical protein E7Z68_10110 [Thermoplasmata archaeon]|nr:hypothetical protein [Thermoplasmata archaeon]